MYIENKEDHSVTIGNDLDRIVRKPNELIEGRNHNTITQNQILDVSLSYAAPNKEGIYESDYTVSSLRQFEGINMSNVSRTLRELSSETSNINRNYTLISANGKIHKFPLIDTFTYDPKASKIHIRYTKGASDMFFRNRDYTTNLLSITTQFKSMPTYRIYEICSAKSYLLYEKGLREVKIQYDLYELKSRICPNPEYELKEQDYAKTLKRMPTAKEMYEKYPELETYKTVADFKRYVLEKAKTDINMFCQVENNSQAFDFEYSFVRGLNGKYKDVVLIITPSYIIDNTEHVPLTEKKDVMAAHYDKSLVPDVMDIFQNDEPISKEGIIGLLIDSNNDIKKIQEVYNLARQQNGIKNLIGWMRSMLQRGYNDPIISNRDMTYGESVEVQQMLDKTHMDNYGTTDESEIQKKLEGNPLLNVEDEYESLQEEMRLLQEKMNRLKNK